MLFPPIPDADTSSGKKPTPGESMSHDSITGAPERHKGEAAEQEANDLVNSVAKVAMESAAGKYGQGVTEDAAPETPPATDSMQVVPVTTDTPTGDTPVEDKTKQPMKAKISKGTDQTMRVVSDITDIYEKFCNVLSPTPPFSTIAARLRLVGILISVCLASFLTSSYMVIKAIGFTVGFGFFGDPIFQWTLGFLNNKVPDWKKHLDLQQTLLKGVPTNAQLTLALLRLGEVHSSPLPPPPSLRDNEPSWPIPRKKSKAPGPGGDNAQGSSSSLSLQKQNSSTETLSGDKPKRKWVSKVFKFVRRTIATAIKSHIALDRAMAIAGSTQTQNLVGMLRKKGWVSAPYGPLKFDAKFERKRGAVVIDSSKEPPLLYFTTYQSSGLDDLQIESRKKGSVLFQIPVTDIRELKKTEGLGWKGKLIVELTAGSKDSADGLVISGTEPDQHYHITGMRGRNQLFNRLIAIDAQFWESY